MAMRNQKWFSTLLVTAQTLSAPNRDFLVKIIWWPLSTSSASVAQNVATLPFPIDVWRIVTCSRIFFTSVLWWFHFSTGERPTLSAKILEIYRYLAVDKRYEDDKYWTYDEATLKVRESYSFVFCLFYFFVYFFFNFTLRIAMVLTILTIAFSLYSIEAAACSLAYRWFTGDFQSSDHGAPS